MDFTFSDDQLNFREAISRFLIGQPAEMLRLETDVGRSPDLRNKIAEQGLTALSVPKPQAVWAWTMWRGPDDPGTGLLRDPRLTGRHGPACALIAGLPASVFKRGEWLAGVPDRQLAGCRQYPVNPLGGRRPNMRTCCSWPTTMKCMPCRAQVDVLQASLDASASGTGQLATSAATLVAEEWAARYGRTSRRVVGGGSVGAGPTPGASVDFPLGTSQIGDHRRFQEIIIQEKIFICLKENEKDSTIFKILKI